jgi:hypothetical protein
VKAYIIRTDCGYDYINQFKYLTEIIHVAMPRFLDVHPMKGLEETLLKEIQNTPADEFGVIHLKILYNPEVDQCFCLVELPPRKQFRNTITNSVSSVIGLLKLRRLTSFF